MNTTFIQTLPTLKKWYERNPEISLEELGSTLQAYQWLAIFSILFPDFEEQDSGYIVWHSRLPEVPLQEIQRQLKTDQAGVELLVNQLSVADLFLNDPDFNSISDTLLHTVAEYISQCWKCHLKSLFPDYHFEVVIANDPEVTVSAHRKRKK